jgi:hypothetical protein
VVRAEDSSENMGLDLGRGMIFHHKASVQFTGQGGEKRRLVTSLFAFVGQHTFGFIIGDVGGYQRRYQRCVLVEKTRTDPIGGSPWNILAGNSENFIRPQTRHPVCTLYSLRSADGRVRCIGMAIATTTKTTAMQNKKRAKPNKVNAISYSCVATDHGGGKRRCCTHEPLGRFVPGNPFERARPRLELNAHGAVSACVPGRDRPRAN